MDLSGWQAIFTELKARNFMIIAAAQDTAGAKAAKQWYERAGVTFKALLDPEHKLTTLYNMVNVPTGVWIDERGTIVRPAETAYTRSFVIMGRKIGDNKYVPALRDWVEKGAKSRYVMSKTKLTQHLGEDSKTQRLAAAEFRLGVYFHRKKQTALAQTHWGRAQRLSPDNWNFHRQAWSFQGPGGQSKWFTKVMGLGSKPYYAPLDWSTEEPKSKPEPAPGPTKPTKPKPKRRWF